MSEFPINIRARRTFSSEEKVALVLLIVAGVGGLFFGFRFMGKNLVTPFSFSYSGPTSLTADEAETARISNLKARDTDTDTLNDYDELYVYKTSPYLADSDSDGYNDDTELASGNDPNCPEGKACNVGVASVDATGDTSGDLLQGLEEPTPPDLNAIAGEGATIDSEEALKNLTPAELRQLLLDNGADKEALDKLSDEELMALYAETLTQYQGEAETP
ncbi:MAG: hypothetical protein AAB865_02765 [Patescibacteria group bacterium]